MADKSAGSVYLDRADVFGHMYAVRATVTEGPGLEVSVVRSGDPLLTLTIKSLPREPYEGTPRKFAGEIPPGTEVPKTPTVAQVYLTVHPHGHYDWSQDLSKPLTLPDSLRQPPLTDPLEDMLRPAFAAALDATRPQKIA